MRGDKALRVTVATGHENSTSGLSKLPRPAGDPLAALERAWARYRDRVQALVSGVTDESRGKVASVLAEHARAIETLAG